MLFHFWVTWVYFIVSQAGGLSYAYWNKTSNFKQLINVCVFLVERAMSRFMPRPMLFFWIEYYRLSLLRYCWDKGDVSGSPDYRYNQYVYLLVIVRIQVLYRNKQYFSISDVVKTRDHCMFKLNIIWFGSNILYCDRKWIR